MEMGWVHPWVGLGHLFPCLLWVGVGLGKEMSHGLRHCNVSRWVG